jgi:putative oxidoreductase
MTTSSSLSPAKRPIFWGVRIFLALVFASAGIAKLVGVPQMVQVFDAIGAGQWFRYLTGSVEILGALLLVVPATGFAGGLLLLATMVGAIFTHLLLIGGNPMPAMVLGLLSAVVSWRLRPAPFPTVTN